MSGLWIQDHTSKRPGAHKMTCDVLPFCHTEIVMFGLFAAIGIIKTPGSIF